MGLRATREADATGGNALTIATVLERYPYRLGNHSPGEKTAHPAHEHPECGAEAPEPLTEPAPGHLA